VESRILDRHWFNHRAGGAIGKVDEVTEARLRGLFQRVKELSKGIPEPRRSNVEETERCMIQNQIPYLYPGMQHRAAKQ
jgi:hypothetical protein